MPEPLEKSNIDKILLTAPVDHNKYDIEKQLFEVRDGDGLW